MQRSLRLAAVITSLLIAAPAWATQVQVQTVSSVAELRETLVPGDNVTLVQVTGESLTGMLVEVGETALQLRQSVPQQNDRPRMVRTVTLPHGTVRSIERLPDSLTNGALIGAVVGGALALLVYSVDYSVDRNEMDEGGGGYFVAGVLYVGLGALIGMAVDNGQSKPRIRFEVQPASPTVRRMPGANGLIARLGR
jgi:hypothetical protein